MTELKTLKYFYSLKGDNEGENSILDDIRQEAVKWIKELETKFDDDVSDCEDCGISKNAVELNAKIDWINHFFNISEKDLK